MAIDTTSLRTRRAILMGALGGTVAAVAAAVGQASPAGATDGDFVRVGHSYSSTSATAINGTGRGAAFFTRSDLGVAFEGSSDSGTGVHGMSTRGLGVGGSSVYGTGVSGSSEARSGVRGTSRVSLGVEGRSRSSTAIHGVSSTTVVNSSTTPDNTGVYGYADQNASAVGVEGHSVSGTGVEGHSGSGLGVFGLSTETTAVYGRSRAKYSPAVVGVSDRGGTTGVQGFSGDWKLLPDAPRNTGVHGYADLDDTAVGVVGESFQGTGGLFIAPKGTALRATGRVQLDNCSGVASIASGANSVRVSPGYNLAANSSVVATLRGNPSGPATVKSVSVDPGSNTFTIHLTANAAGALSVAWHLFG